MKFYRDCSAISDDLPATAVWRNELYFADRMAGGKKMKLKELKKVLALSVAVSMAVPGSVWAAAPGEKISVGEYEAGG